MSNLGDIGQGERTETLVPSTREHPRTRGRLTGRRDKWSGRGRGGKPNATSLSSEYREQATAPARSQPTHFLALPLNNHPSLINQINAFQKGLFSGMDELNDNFASKSTSSPALKKGSKVTPVTSSLVGGLDSSILIDTRRLHITLGVMALDQDDSSIGTPTEQLENASTAIVEEPPNSSSTITSMTGEFKRPETIVSVIEATATSLLPDRPLTKSQPLSIPLGHSAKKTTTTALSLLNSLKPRISEILDGGRGVNIPLEIMHVLKTQKMWLNMKKKGKGSGVKKEGVSGGGERKDEDGGRDDSGPTPNNDMKEKETIGAGVLYLAPEMKNKHVNTDIRKLAQVSDLVHQTFKDAGYLTERRPLKLHCTILNTSYRKPHFRQPFSYSDILTSDALRILCGNASDLNSHTKQGGSLSLEGEAMVPKETVEEVPSSVPIQTEPSTPALQPNLPSRLNPSPKSSNVHITSRGQNVIKNSPSVSVNLGVFSVEEIQLWVMGSHGPNNEYVSCGGIDWEKGKSEGEKTIKGFGVAGVIEKPVSKSWVRNYVDCNEVGEQFMEDM